MKHFGVVVRPGKYGLNLSRETYAIINNKNSLGKLESMKDCYADVEGNYYTNDWCQKHRANCLKNFDLNMHFFSSLSHDDFNEELNTFLNENNNFIKVHDLKEYENTKGYYLMILDKYSQVYIGTTDNIKKRIQQHWSTQKSFDRLLFPIGAVDKSVLSIDCFRALDTTRIFVYKTNYTYSLENKFITKFSPKFISNRMGGGKLCDGLFGLLQALSTMKFKEL